MNKSVIKFTITWPNKGVVEYTYVPSIGDIVFAKFMAICVSGYCYSR